MTFLLTVMCKVPRIQKNEVVATRHGNCAIIQWSNPTKEARWKITPCFSPDISIYRCQCAPTLMSPSIETFFLVSHSKKANIVQVLCPKSEAEEQTTHFSNALPTLNPIAGGGSLGVCVNQCHPSTPGSLFTEDALALAVWIVMNGVDTGRKRREELWSITESREQKEISKAWAIQATSRKDFSTQGFINHGSQGHTILWKLNVHSFLFLP